jgi:broad specificity phosphatase PhoE
MTPTPITFDQPRLDAIDAIPGLTPDGRRILYQLAEEVDRFEERTDQVPMSIRASAQEDFQLMLQAFELAVKVAGGHYHEG